VSSQRAGRFSAVVIGLALVATGTSAAAVSGPDRASGSLNLGAIAGGSAGGPTPATLTAAGWDCFQTPPFVVPPRSVCANPGLGRPLPGNPDPQPAYTLPTFDLAGNYLGKVHLIRVDLYRGEACQPSGDPDVFRAPIGYYECLRT
jgi:hypothetical protein